MKLNNNDDSHNSGLNLLIYNMLLDIESHPAWVCGLKLSNSSFTSIRTSVTPCVGVWIETTPLTEERSSETVTPCVGVWIETKNPTDARDLGLSHPAWVCGLKRKNCLQPKLARCHTLRGCVD